MQVKLGCALFSLGDKRSALDLFEKAYDTQIEMGESPEKTEWTAELLSSVRRGLARQDAFQSKPPEELEEPEDDAGPPILAGPPQPAGPADGTRSRSLDLPSDPAPSEPAPRDPELTDEAPEEAPEDAAEESEQPDESGPSEQNELPQALINKIFSQEGN